jgi:hypothetical protein
MDPMTRDGNETEAWSLDRLLSEYEISFETLLRVLVRKGLVHPSELVQEEQARRERLRLQEESYRRSTAARLPDVGVQDVPYRKPRSWLKRQMAKRRWTRRLGTWLFGWKWKKVYHHRHSLPTGPEA